MNGQDRSIPEGILSKTIRVFPVGLAFFILILLPSASQPGQFSVSPITLHFEEGTKSGVITIVNEEDRKLQVQMKAFEWTQDTEGKDQYAETNDILFFPKIMLINANEQRILRTGIKSRPAGREKTYRLFIEEIPEPRQKVEGAQIQVAIRFGVPIFIKPAKKEVQGVIEKAAFKEGHFQVSVKNTGNSHFIIHSILVKGSDREGTETFSKELSGWYLLTGASRTYATPVSSEVCRSLSKIDLEVKTTEFTLNDTVDVDKALCPS